MATLPAYNESIVPNKAHDKEGDMMCILIYEEDWKRRLELERTITQYKKENELIAQVVGFNDAQKAFLHAQENHVETAFISMEDKFGHGFFLAKRLKKKNPQLNLIPMSEELRFEEELMKMHVSGYLTEPYTKEKVQYELENLRYGSN